MVDHFGVYSGKYVMDQNNYKVQAICIYSKSIILIGEIYSNSILLSLIKGLSAFNEESSVSNIRDLLQILIRWFHVNW